MPSFFPAKDLPVCVTSSLATITSLLSLPFRLHTLLMLVCSQFYSFLFVIGTLDTSCSIIAIRTNPCFWWHSVTISCMAFFYVHQPSLTNSSAFYFRISYSNSLLCSMQTLSHIFSIEKIFGTSLLQACLESKVSQETYWGLTKMAILIWEVFREMPRAWAFPSQERNSCNPLLYNSMSIVPNCQSTTS